MGLNYPSGPAEPRPSLIGAMIPVVLVERAASHYCNLPGVMNELIGDVVGRGKLAKAQDPYIFRGPRLCRARRPLVLGLLLGLAVAALAIATSA